MSVFSAATQIYKVTSLLAKFFPDYGGGGDPSVPYAYFPLLLLLFLPPYPDVSRCLSIFLTAHLPLMNQLLLQQSDVRGRGGVALSYILHLSFDHW